MISLTFILKSKTKFPLLIPGNRAKKQWEFLFTKGETHISVNELVALSYFLLKIPEFSKPWMVLRRVFMRTA